MQSANDVDQETMTRAEDMRGHRTSEKKKRLRKRDEFLRKKKIPVEKGKEGREPEWNIYGLFFTCKSPGM